MPRIAWIFAKVLPCFCYSARRGQPLAIMDSSSAFLRATRSRISRSRSSTSVAFSILRNFSPSRYIRCSGVPPVIPISASLASPGPFTMQPITATSMEVFTSSSRDSSSFMVPITSKFCREQLGQAMKLIPRVLSRRLLRISKPTLISSTGSAASEMRMVSPMPSASSIPRPTEDLTAPERKPRPR